MNKLVACPACRSTDFRDLIETRAQMHSSEDVFQFQKCSDCQLVFLNPRLPEEKLKDYYTDYYLPYRGPEAWGVFRGLVASDLRSLDKKRVEFVRQHHRVTRETKILDVGCGKPTFLNAFKDSCECQVYGIDFSDEGWKDDTGKFENLHLMTGEVSDIPRDIQPDVITMWHYLEHDYHPDRTLDMLHEMSAEKATMVIEVPNYDSESRKEYGQHWAGYHTPRHTFLFSPDNIEMMLNRTGWEVVELNTYGTLDPYNLYWMSEMEKKGIDWSKNMASEFFGYFLGMIGFLPKRLDRENRSLGIMSVVARKK